jgi:hypothetical protein
MKIDLQPPFNTDWECGYVVVNPESRKTVLLIRDSVNERSSVSLARYLMCVNLGRYLLPNEHVDHINEDKTDDRIENLQILSPNENIAKMGAHKRAHAAHGNIST